MVFDKRRLLTLVVFLLCCVITHVCNAGTAQYIYDDLGRLRTAGDDSGNFATYMYDEVGNLLSINSASTTPNPPLVQSISPEVLFIGVTTPISIVGQNLVTVKDIAVDKPFTYTRILSVTDTEIKAEVTVAAPALPGTANLTLKTFFGMANIQTELTTSKLSLGPGLLVLAPGGSNTISASINPSIAKNITIQIRNSDQTIVSTPQSAIIPAGGPVTFSINALKVGIATIGSGDQKTVVRVTTEAFTPMPGEGLTIPTAPVSVYIDNPMNNALQGTSPVSVSIDAPQDNSALQSPPYSVAIDASGGGSCNISSPVSVFVDQSAGNALAPTSPVSVYIDQMNNAIQLSYPVSVYLDQAAANAMQASMPVSVYLDQASAFQLSNPVSVYLDQAAAVTIQTSMPVSVYLDQASAFQLSYPVSVYLDQAADTIQASMPVSVFLDQTGAATISPSPPVSVYLDQTAVTIQTSMPVSVYLDPTAATTISPSSSVSVSIDSSAGNAATVSLPVSTKISPP